MRRKYERDTKARPSFSGAPHALVNMVDSISMEEVNVGENKKQEMARLLRCISYTKFPQIVEVLLDFHRLFGSTNSPASSILHYPPCLQERVARQMEASLWCTHSAHSCETHMIFIIVKYTSL